MASNRDISISNAQLRMLVRRVLPTDADFEAFCLDFFPKIKSRFSLGMDRLTKETLFLEIVDPQEALEKLKQYVPDEFNTQLKKLVDAGQIDPVPERLGALPVSLAMEVDRISNLEHIDGHRKSLYTTAGEHDGVVVYGRGQRILLSLVNRGSSTLIIRSLRLRLLARVNTFPSNLRYNKMQMTLPHTRLPIESIRAPIYIQADDYPQTTKEIGEGRIQLAPKGSSASLHQISFTVEAKGHGLSSYQLEAEYIDQATNKQTTEICRDKFTILLRGR